MSADLLPVSPRDLRAALQLCKAKFESIASEYRDSEYALDDDANACGSYDSESADSYRADAERAKGDAESCDRMAQQVGALLRAPDMPTAPLYVAHVQTPDCGGGVYLSRAYVREADAESCLLHWVNRQLEHERGKEDTERNERARPATDWREGAERASELADDYTNPDENGFSVWLDTLEADSSFDPAKV